VEFRALRRRIGLGAGSTFCQENQSSNKGHSNSRSHNHTDSIAHLTWRAPVHVKIFIGTKRNRRKAFPLTTAHSAFE